MPAGVVVIYGADPALLSQALTKAVHTATGGAAADQQGPLDTALLADAAVVPMFGDQRTLVARNANTATSEIVDALCAYASDPAPTTKLIVEWSAATIPAALRAAVTAGHIDAVDANAPRTAGERTGLIAQKVRNAEVNLDGQAKALIIAIVGEDVGRVDGILSVLTATYGPGANLGVADVEPYVGAAGSVPPWELTDNISAGKAGASLVTLDRLLGAGERHPLQVLAVLRSHYDRIFRVAAVGETDEKRAAKLLGLKGSTFPAKKAIAESRRFGPERSEAAMTLLAAADVALKGRSGLPDRTTLEVLVGRLASLHR